MQISYNYLVHEKSLLSPGDSRNAAKLNSVPSIERVAAEIESFEGFAVRIKPVARAASKTNLKSYARSHERIARASFTVADWKRRRFDDVYPDFAVEVLLADGRIASPKMLLSKIRASYE